MSAPFTLAIPGIRFELHASAAIEIAEKHPLYREFVGDTERTTDSVRVPVEIVVDDPRIDTGWPVVFDSGDSWLALHNGGDMVFAFRSPTDPGAFWWTAQFTPGTTNVRVTCDPEVIERTPTVTRIANPIHYPLDQLLTMFLLAQRGGCIVHAAGVHRKGRGIACIGRSGAGKTTLMSLLEGRTDLERLSDDRLILRTGEPSLVSGTPWAGEGMVAANDTADLAALIFLHQGPAHALQPITPREAAAQLLPTTSIPWFDEVAMTGCLATLDRLIGDTPAFNLFFRLDGGVADLIDRLI